jgi:hypothetical protein
VGVAAVLITLKEYISILAVPEVGAPPDHLDVILDVPSPSTCTVVIYRARVLFVTKTVNDATLPVVTPDRPVKLIVALAVELAVKYNVLAVAGRVILAAIPVAEILAFSKILPKITKPDVAVILLEVIVVIPVTLPPVIVTLALEILPVTEAVILPALIVTLLEVKLAVIVPLVIVALLDVKLAVTAPPVTLILEDSWVDIVPRPKLVLISANVVPPVLARTLDLPIYISKI